jgi:ribose transport system substrate-binding protein
MRYRSLGALLAVAVLLAGCGSSGASSNTSTSAGASSSASSGGSSSSSSTSGSSGINVAQAKKDLDAVIDTPDTIVLPKVGKPIPKNQTIDFMTCPLAICTEVGTGVQQAAAVLGWHVRSIAMNGTPAGYKTAWDQIAQNPGDGVVVTDPVLPYTSVASEMTKANVPVVSSTSPNPVGGHLVAVVASSGDVKRQGEVEANWVIQDAGKPVKTVFVYDPSIISVASALPGYEQEMKQNCPACGVAVLKVSAAQIGPALAQQVVSYLQSNPDVKYVAFGLGDLATGVPAAIKAAGLENQVKITTRAATPPNLEDVKGGGMTAAFTAEIYEAGWRSVDKLVRSLSGAPIGNPYPFSTVRQITQANLPSNLSVPFSLPNYEQGFKEAWGLS